MKHGRVPPVSAETRSSVGRDAWTPRPSCACSSEVQFDLPSNSKPLDGVRVLDFSHALAGPYCTMLLADFGAEIIKLESPDGGDMGRGWGPPFAGDYSSFFLGLNRGKRGVAIDLKKPAGMDLCLASPHRPRRRAD